MGCMSKTAYITIKLNIKNTLYPLTGGRGHFYLSAVFLYYIFTLHYTALCYGSPLSSDMKVSTMACFLASIIVIFLTIMY